MMLIAVSFKPYTEYVLLHLLPLQIFCRVCTNEEFFKGLSSYQKSYTFGYLTQSAIALLNNLFAVGTVFSISNQSISTGQFVSPVVYIRLSAIDSSIFPPRVLFFQASSVKVTYSLSSVSRVNTNESLVNNL